MKTEGQGSASPPLESERDAFEKWAVSEGYRNLTREGDPDNEFGIEPVYCEPAIHAAWHAWQARPSSTGAAEVGVALPLTDAGRIAASIGLGVFPAKCSDEEARRWLTEREASYGPEQALRDLGVLESMLGGRNGPSIKLRAWVERALGAVAVSILEKS